MPSLASWVILALVLLLAVQLVQGLAMENRQLREARKAADDMADGFAKKVRQQPAFKDLYVFTNKPALEAPQQRAKVGDYTKLGVAIPMDQQAFLEDQRTKLNAFIKNYSPPSTVVTTTGEVAYVNHPYAPSLTERDIEDYGKLTLTPREPGTLTVSSLTLDECKLLLAPFRVHDYFNNLTAEQLLHVAVDVLNTGAVLLDRPRTLDVPNSEPDPDAPGLRMTKARAVLARMEDDDADDPEGNEAGPLVLDEH